MCSVPEMSGVLLWVNCGTKGNSISLLGLGGRGSRSQRRYRLCSGISFASFSSAVAEPSRSSEERVYEVVLKQAALVKEQKRDTKRKLNLDKPIEDDFTNKDLLSGAYDRCGEVCAEYAKTFYLGTHSFSLLFSLSLVPTSNHFKCIFKFIIISVPY